MSETKIITSAQNPKVKNAAQLRDKKGRDSQKLMLIDGYRALNLALKNNFAVKELYYCEKLFKPNEEKLLKAAQARGIAIFHLSEKAFAKVSYGDNPDGLVAVARQEKKELADLPLGKSALYLILDSVEKPGNLGAILRTADAAAVTAVIVCDAQTDLYNPNVIRSSRGAIFTVPAVQSPGKAVLAWLKANQIKLIAATGFAATDYTTADFSSPCAIVLGSEDKGISPQWLNAADLKIKIPMSGQVDSLNVSVAAAIVLYEAVRQRRT